MSALPEKRWTRITIYPHIPAFTRQFSAQVRCEVRCVREPNWDVALIIRRRDRRGWNTWMLCRSFPTAESAKAAARRLALREVGRGLATLPPGARP